MMSESSLANEAISNQVHEATGLTYEEIIRDFEWCCLSREASLLARREVLTGKAKFGIIGDGKEVPQVTLARFFQKGDFRSGYYRDQTLHMALGLCSLEEFFAQLYADVENDPFSKGRQMNNHFATPLINEAGEWLKHTELHNISADVSSTGGQMARALGLALASKKYREGVGPKKGFSDKGNEVVFCTIGDASTSEGPFWETINAAGVLQVPLATLVWDDGYGISVPIEYQTTKASISVALAGMAANSEKENGIVLFEVKGWDYPALVNTYREAVELCRTQHRPVLVHVQEVTQPQGHSTSGSHERYKSKERLAWEAEFDCIEKMAAWMLEEGILEAAEVEEIRKNAKKEAKAARNRAWKAYQEPIQRALNELKAIYQGIPEDQPAVIEAKQSLGKLLNPQFHEVVQNGRRMYYALLETGRNTEAEQLRPWLRERNGEGHHRYESNLYSESENAALRVPVVPAEYGKEAPLKNGFEVLNAFFDQAFERQPELVAFGEDVGQIGDVNQGFAGMQKKYGEERVFDTGIREWTIMGQAIGMAMRGLRPIAEIQYLDYLIYGLSPLSDDLATLRWRSAGQQMAPAIIRTRGHRLEGIWHAGSPLGMILNALRGIYVLVPRNMTQAAGMYNTMLQSDDPALIIECLNGYRLKERLPDNLNTFTVPLGVPEVLQEGSDLTLVTYGSCVRVAQAGMDLLEKHGISVELIDVQTLLPFDLEHRIVESLKKTNRILFLDEDVPGGASAYMMREVLEVQGGYRWLDSAPRCLTAKAHRPPYGSDGDYFSKPNPEDVFEQVYQMVYEAEPARFAGPLF